MWFDIDGLVQERHNSIANALELRLSCTNHRYHLQEIYWPQEWHICNCRTDDWDMSPWTPFEDEISWRPFYWHGLTLIPAWKSHYNDEITYPFPYFNSANVKVWEWISNFIQHFIEHYLSMLGSKFNYLYVRKRGPWRPIFNSSGRNSRINSLRLSDAYMHQ